MHVSKMLAFLMEIYKIPRITRPHNMYLSGHDITCMCLPPTLNNPDLARL